MLYLKVSKRNNMITLQGKNHTIMEFPEEEIDSNWENIKNLALLYGFINSGIDTISVKTNDYKQTKEYIVGALYKEDIELLLKKYRRLYPKEHTQESKFGIIYKEDQSIDYAVIIKNHCVCLYNPETLNFINIHENSYYGCDYFLLKRLLDERVDLVSIAQTSYQTGFFFLLKNNEFVLNYDYIPRRFPAPIDIICPIEKLLALITEPFINETKEESTATISYLSQERINEAIIAVHPEAVIPVAPRTICAPLQRTPNAAPPVPPVPQTEPLNSTIQTSTTIPSSITITNKEQIADEEEFDLPF